MQGRGEEKVRALIGSRPPTCERRCRTCSHCEAIQVPVITQEAKAQTNKESLDLASNLEGDYNSNYKPLSWKCKCGSFIFDPWSKVWANTSWIVDNKKIHLRSKLLSFIFVTFFTYILSMCVKFNVFFVLSACLVWVWGWARDKVSNFSRWCRD